MISLSRDFFNFYVICLYVKRVQRGHPICVTKNMKPMVVSHNTRRKRGCRNSMCKWNYANWDSGGENKEGEEGVFEEWWVRWIFFFCFFLLCFLNLESREKKVLCNNPLPQPNSKLRAWVGWRVIVEGTIILMGWDFFGRSMTIFSFSLLFDRHDYCRTLCAFLFSCDGCKKDELWMQMQNKNRLKK